MKEKQVNLTTFIDRCTRGDMIQTFKILNRSDNVDYKLWFTKCRSIHGEGMRRALFINDKVQKVFMNLNVSMTNTKTKLQDFS